VLERDRMDITKAENLTNNKIPAILIESILPVSIHMCYKKAANGKYSYTLTMSLSTKHGSRSIKIPLFQQKNFFSKSSKVASLAKLKTDITKSIKAKMRLMSVQATYFEQTKEYDKSLAITEALFALDPKNQSYKIRRNKMYKKLNSKR
jgi:hypothetical protein